MTPRFAAAAETDKTIDDNVLAWYVIDMDVRRAPGSSYDDFVIMTLPVRPLNNDGHGATLYWPNKTAERLVRETAKLLNGAIDDR